MDNWDKICIFTFIIILATEIAFYIGYKIGVKHVLNDAEFLVTSFEEPNEEYDFEFYIDIDEKTYTRYGYIG